MTLAYWFAVLCLALAGRYQYRRAVADFDLLLGHESTVRTQSPSASESQKESREADDGR